VPDILTFFTNPLLALMAGEGKVAIYLPVFLEAQAEGRVFHLSGWEFRAGQLAPST
jgi:hypothetical protein